MSLVLRLLRCWFRLLLHTFGLGSIQLCSFRRLDPKNGHGQLPKNLVCCCCRASFVWTEGLCRSGLRLQHPCESFVSSLVCLANAQTPVWEAFFVQVRVEEPFGCCCICFLSRCRWSMLPTPEQLASMTSIADVRDSVKVASTV